MRGYWGGAEPPAPVQNKAAASGRCGARGACAKGQTGAHLLALTSSRQLILKGGMRNANYRSGISFSECRWQEENL